MEGAASDALSPLAGVSVFEDVLRLPYFEFLSCMGEFSLHPGGLEATVALLRAADLRKGDRILEIGCGPGHTTRVLLAAGLDVSVVEPSERMLRAALRNCALGAGKRPKSHLCEAEDLTMLSPRSYDVALYECVFGFIPRPKLAIRECARVLSGAGARVCVIDLHYVADPPAPVRAALEGVFGREIAVLYEEDWKNLFSSFRLCHWQDADIVTPAAPSAEGVHRLLSDAAMLAQLPGSGDERFEKLSERWRTWNDVFVENKRYMRTHCAIWAMEEQP
jgi:ubiquinone/menaquinone biosynthesis C-methylase UbiE